MGELEDFFPIHLQVVCAGWKINLMAVCENEARGSPPHLTPWRKPSRLRARIQTRSHGTSYPNNNATLTGRGTSCTAEVNVALPRVVLFAGGRAGRSP